MLKPRRISHVWGCEHEARHLAERWGCDPDAAAEAGILHDCTKKLELSDQLLLSDKYGIINDTVETANTKLLHAKTGAAVAKDRFGVPLEIENAIRWHTTGKPDMTTLEKVLYMADYIEPSRDFDGVDELRRLAYTDLDAAMVLGLKMSLEDLEAGVLPVLASIETAAYDGAAALQQINDVKYNDLGSAFEAVKRSAEVALLPMRP